MRAMLVGGLQWCKDETPGPKLANNFAINVKIALNL